VRLSGLAPVVGDSTEVLILGSFPGKKSLDDSEYYADGRNKFWEIVGDFLRVPSPASYSQRCEALLRRKLGLWDVIRSCIREGSSDSAIKGEEPNDLGGLLHDHPSIRVVLFNGLGRRGPLKFFRQFARKGRIVVPVRIRRDALHSSACVDTHMTVRDKADSWGLKLRELGL
jgi:hypoxanthine-DNA glycosylase